MEPVTVKILLRHSGGSHPYTDTDRLREAGSFCIDPEAWGGIEQLLSIVLDQLTIAEPTAEFAIRYRRLYLRSLRVGDVVVCGEAAWALDEPSGEWRLVSVQASQMVLPGMHATRFLVTQRRWRGDWRAFTKDEVASRQGAEIVADGRSPATPHEWLARSLLG